MLPKALKYDSSILKTLGIVECEHSKANCIFTQSDYKNLSIQGGPPIQPFS